MPLSTATVGGTTGALEHAVDARWLMAYAAGLGDLNPEYMDTAAHTVIGHPVFPVCVEWPVILNIREIAGAAALTPEEAARGVHASHDLHIHRPVRAGDRLSTQATMIEAKRIRPGAAYILRLDTIEVTSGELVAQTYQTGIYRGVEVEGEDTCIERAPALPELAASLDGPGTPIFVPEGAAHTYTECARIWNPIHTDRAVALSAGLPDIILHGTATLALAVSQVVKQYADNDPCRVARLGGRFSAMVLMPSTITLQTHKAGNTISYQVLTEDGQPAISNGFVILDRTD